MVGYTVNSKKTRIDKKYNGHFIDWTSPLKFLSQRYRPRLELFRESTETMYRDEIESN